MTIHITVYVNNKNWKTKNRDKDVSYKFRDGVDGVSEQVINLDSAIHCNGKTSKLNSYSYKT